MPPKAGLDKFKYFWPRGLPWSRGRMFARHPGGPGLNSVYSKSSFLQGTDEFDREKSREYGLNQKREMVRLELGQSGKSKEENYQLLSKSIEI